LKTRLAIVRTAAWLSVMASAGLSQADVVVVLNQCQQPVSFTAETTIGPPRQLTLPAGEMVAIPMRAAMQIVCPAVQADPFELGANSACYFSPTDQGTIRLVELELNSDQRSLQGRDLGAPQDWGKIAVIPVKILVDQREPAVREQWEDRYRKRFEAASEIFVRLFRIRFQVVAAGTWRSESGATEFPEAFDEFERVVNPEPARLAVGFTSQLRALGQQGHLGGLRSPLRSHVLIREQAGRLTEIERLEVLVHELGHYLGAAHSPEGSSVMRPVLGDGRARWTGFRIRFDPVNALAGFLVGEEIRFRNVTKFSEVTPGTAQRLNQLYRVLAEAKPDDPVAQRYLAFLESTFEPRSGSPGTSGAMPMRPREWPATATRSILARLAVAAESNAALPRTPVGPDPRYRRTGDELTEYYVREAARAAAGLELPPRTAAQAFLMALGIGLDHSETLPRNPLFADFCRSVEHADQRAARLRVLGDPTMLGRRDLAQHFAVSCLLTASHGPAIAETAGVAKEILDARGGSGFSFADLAADLAGIALAEKVLAERILLTDLAVGFRVSDFVPEVADLPEGLTWDDFTDRFGSIGSDAYRDLRARILDRIGQLPGHRP
jgi:hypothetical protein